MLYGFSWVRVAMSYLSETNDVPEIVSEGEGKHQVSGVGRRLEPGAPLSVAEPASSGAGKQSAQRSWQGVLVGLFAIAVVGIVAYGALRRDENWITPEHGLGYLLGIVGSVFMLILLGYPLRKRFSALRGLGRLPGWLKFHMLLGILGPALILFHANFRLGATNSNVALLTMLIVVTSGIVGRYIYGKTHNRLSGELRSLQEFRRETQAARREINFDFTRLPELQRQLDELEARVLDPEHGILSSTWLYLDFALSKGAYRRRFRHVLRAAINADAGARGLDARYVRGQLDAASRYLSEYLRRLQRAAEFRFYERMFALWHVLHVPLLFLLIVAAVVHIAAVHLY